MKLNQTLSRNSLKLVLSLAMLAGAPCLASTGFTAFSLLEKTAQAIPTMRDYHKRDALSVADYGFKDATLYTESRMIEIDPLDQALDSFFGMMQGRIENQALWRGKTLNLETQLDITDKIFTPYAQKLVLKEKDVFLCKGDLHGDVHSLIAFIRQLQDFGYTSEENPYKIVDPNFYLIFLGDYTDRGLWGTEVIYLLLQLAIHNPGQVFLVRGNHEDPAVTQIYGFQKEFLNKFNDVPDKKRSSVLKKIAKLYEFLPVVLYVGAPASVMNNKSHDNGLAQRKAKARDGESEKKAIEETADEKEYDFIQMCHGGIEMGWNPKKLLAHPTAQFEEIRKIKRATACKDWHHMVKVEDRITKQSRLYNIAKMCSDFEPDSPLSPSPLGFMWHDFVVFEEGCCEYKEGRGFACNKAVTEAVRAAASTEKIRLSAIIRAHQHSNSKSDPMMNLLLKSDGCAVLWWKELKPEFLAPGMVVTLLLSPDSMLGVPNISGNGFLGFDYDTSLFVTVGATFTQWQMRVINNTIFQNLVVEGLRPSTPSVNSPSTKIMLPPLKIEAIKDE